MHASFQRSLAARLPGHCRPALRGACLGAIGVASLLASACSSAPHANALVPPAQPTHGVPTTCAGMRQFLASHAMGVPTPILRSGEHRAYQLDLLGPFPEQPTWRPGATMRFAWCADTWQPTTDAHAQPERMTTQFIGPFDSQEATSQVMQKLSPQAATPGGPQYPNVATLGPIAASAPVLTTNTWSNADITVTLQLPSTLKPGFYVGVSRVEMQPGSANGVVEIPESDAIYQISAS